MPNSRIHTAPLIRFLSLRVSGRRRCKVIALVSGVSMILNECRCRMVAICRAYWWFYRRVEATLVGIQRNNEYMRVFLAFEEQCLQSTVMGCLKGEKILIEDLDVKVEMYMFGYC